MARVITFEGGHTFEVPESWPTRMADRVVAVDSTGAPMGYVEDLDMHFGLTMCCAASFKGLEHGVGCRACYALDDGSMGNDMPVGKLRFRTDRPQPPSVESRVADATAEAAKLSAEALAWVLYTEARKQASTSEDKIDMAAMLMEAALRLHPSLPTDG